MKNKMDELTKEEYDKLVKEKERIENILANRPSNDMDICSDLWS